MTRRFLFAAVALLASLPAFSQGPPANGRGSGGPGGSAGPGGAGRVNFLAGLLSLTDAQKEQATAIFSAAGEAAETLAGQMTSAHQALNAATKANSGDAEIDRLAAALGAIQGQMAAVHAKASAKFYSILTAEQKAKYDEIGPRGPGMAPGPRGAFGMPRGR